LRTHVLRHGYQIVDLAIVRRNLDDMIAAAEKSAPRKLILSNI